MYKGLILVWLCILLPLGGALGQGNTSLSLVDAKTSELFVKKDWNALINEGKSAIDQGIDYYYLRVRLGVAYFEKGDYHQAAHHLEIAKEINDEEEYVREYLYYAYLWSGRKFQARLISAGFSPQMKNKTQTDGADLLDGLEFAYNYTGQVNQQVIDNFSASTNPQTEGYQFIPRFHHYGFLGLDLNLGDRFKLYQGFSILRATHLLYSQGNGVSFQNPSYISDSWQYFLSGTYYLGQGFHFTAGGHFINNTFPLQEVQQMGNGQQALVVIQDQKDSDYLVFGGLSKNLTYLNLGANIFYGTINNGKQVQSDLNLTLFPGGNLNFYTFSVVTYQNQEFANASSSQRIIFNQELGGKVTEFIWLEGYATFGELENYFYKQGLVVFNRLDKIQNRWGGRVIILPNPQWKLTLDYTNFSNTSSFQTLPPSVEQNVKSYSLQSITAILSWTF
ncbi:tetratricopeptide repeat protein [Algoriphagus sp. AK58]|uniref:tetratricopeptide repeat protein n=1 Tax=Algoriphagus sp. AK58 TaxID=1406877 RepID=UPI00164FB1A1|nr:hypothetical protein [Algoriphagus sp. AK58]MBC6366843.1 hypothetical protein [Algoriphagus sp. AK58]